MPFQKGMKKVPGSGRKGKGRSPNKKGAFDISRLTDMLNEYVDTGLMAADIASLEPKDRLYVMERYLQYTTPKKQAVQADINTDDTATKLEDRLAALAYDEEDPPTEE